MPICKGIAVALYQQAPIDIYHSFNLLRFNQYTYVHIDALTPIAAYEFEFTDSYSHKAKNVANFQTEKAPIYCKSHYEYAGSR